MRIMNFTLATLIGGCLWWALMTLLGVNNIFPGVYFAVSALGGLVLALRTRKPKKA